SRRGRTREQRRSGSSGSSTEHTPLPSLSPPQHELGRLGPREEAERHERRPETRRDVEHPARPAVEPLCVRPLEMREPDLPAAVRHDDLARVEMPRENEVEHARLYPVYHAREVAE